MKDSIKKIFIYVKEKCPVCKNEIINRYIRSKSYSISTQDGDGRPLEIQWVKPEFIGIRPQDYFIWICDKCFYADRKKSFQDEKDRGKGFDYIKEQILMLSGERNNLLKKIYSLINYKKEIIEPSSAYFAHLLSLYEQETLTKLFKHYEKITFLYIRLGWYFKDLREGLIKETDKLEKAFKTSSTIWDNAPKSEEDCVARALDYMKSNTGQVERISSRERIKNLMLMGELANKVQDYSLALTCAKDSFDIARRRRNEVQAILEGKNVKTTEYYPPDKLLTEVDWLNKFIELIKLFRDKIVSLVIDNELPKAIDKLHSKNITTINESVSAELRKEGFHEETIRKLSELFQKSIPTKDHETTVFTQEKIEEIKKKIEDETKLAKTNFWQIVFDYIKGKKD